MPASSPFPTFRDSEGRALSPPSFRGARRASPESITTKRRLRHTRRCIALTTSACGYGFRAHRFAMPRNDDGESPHSFPSTFQPADTRPHSRGTSRPSSATNTPLRKQTRGRRECRVKASPMARLQTKSRRQSPQVQPVNRHSPRAGLNAYTCSPRGPARLPPSLTRRAGRRRQLGLSTGRPGPHDFTSASMSFVGMAFN